MGVLHEAGNYRIVRLGEAQGKPVTLLEESPEAWFFQLIPFTGMEICSRACKSGESLGVFVIVAVTPNSFELFFRRAVFILEKVIL